MIEDLKKYSDEELVKLASGNDSQSSDIFNLIYKRYSKSIMAYCRLVEKNRELVDDVFQEAWIGLYNAILAGKSINNISSFLITIIRRKLIDEIRRKKRKESNLCTEAINNLADKDLAFGSVDLIEKAMLSLPEKYREPIILCKVNGLKYKEIAETLNLSNECIKKRIHRGIGMLREYLEQSGEIER